MTAPEIPDTILAAAVNARRAALLAAVLALPAGAAGCTKVACFQWTEIEGACPSQEEALAFFETQDCDAVVASIDSAPEYDGEFCCYEVTHADVDACTEVGVEPRPAPPPSPPADRPCSTCSAAIFQPSTDPRCPESEALFQDAFACACEAACAGACADSLCADARISEPCVQCMQDTEAGCGGPLMACMNEGAPQPPP